MWPLGICRMLYQGNSSSCNWQHIQIALSAEILFFRKTGCFLSSSYSFSACELSLVHVLLTFSNKPNSLSSINNACTRIRLLLLAKPNADNSADPITALCEAFPQEGTDCDSFPHQYGFPDTYDSRTQLNSATAKTMLIEGLKNNKEDTAQVNFYPLINLLNKKSSRTSLLVHTCPTVQISLLM